MKSLPVFLATALCLGLSAIHANATTQFEVTVNSGSPLADGATLDFGSVGLYMPKTLVVTIRNPGAEAPPLSLSINLTNSPGSDLYDFGVGAPNSPLTLGANESVAVPITLTATDPGTFTANLRVTETEDPDSTLGLTLTGTVLFQPQTSFNWNSADGNWDADSNWNVGQVPPPTKTLNGQPYDSSVNITNGGIARKTGGLIQTGILSISNGTLVLTDGADIANTLFTGGTIVDSPISIGENGTLRIGDGGAPGGSLSLTEQIQGMGTTGPGVGATIVFNHEAPFYQFAPRLTGSIKVRHEGTGTTTLLDTSNAHGAETP